MSRPWRRGGMPTGRQWTSSAATFHGVCLGPLLELTFDAARGAADQRCMRTHHRPPGGCPGGEIVTKALELLRANYVFPGQAERAAAAIEARLAAASTTGWTRSRSPSWSPSTCKRPPMTGTWR